MNKVKLIYFPGAKQQPKHCLSTRLTVSTVSKAITAIVSVLCRESCEWHRSPATENIAMRKMGVARARAPWLPVVLVMALILQDAVAQEDEIVFNAESTAYVLEEQPVGTVAAVLEAFYLFYSPFQLGIDGFFSLNTSQPDAQFFTIESAPNGQGSATMGTLRTAAVLDRDAEGAQTMFALTVTYSTPDSYLSSQRTVSIHSLISLPHGAPRRP